MDNHPSAIYNRRIEKKESGKMKDLTTEKPLKVIIGFTIPILLGNIFNLAYNLADIRIVGSFLGDEALAAVGSVSTLNDLVIGFVVGLAQGFAVLTARYYGMKDYDMVRKNFAQTVLWGMLISIVVTVGSLWGMEGLLNWLNVAEAQRADASSYIGVIMCGLIFNCLYNVMASSLRSIGDSITPLILLIFSAVLNVGLDVLCVGSFGMGIRGAALATVFSQMVSALFCFAYAMVRYPMLRFKGKDFRIDMEELKELFAGGFSMGLMNSLVAFGTVSLQTAINTFGTNTIVAHTAARKLTGLYMLPFGVLGISMATFSGQNYGANKIERIKEGLKASLLISYGWVVVVQLITFTITPELIHLLTATDVEEVMRTGTLYLKVDTCFYLLVPTISILRNSLQGIGDHVTPIISSGLELIGKVLVAYLLTPVLAYWGIIWSEPIVWSIMVIPLIYSMVKKLCREENASLC